MILTAEHPATNLYRVEVSGWDDNKSFFVENSELEWVEEISNDRARPVAYQAEFLTRNPEGQRQFRLRPVSSRCKAKLCQ